MIKTKRAYEPASPDDGRRFLVDQFWPRGVRREALRLEVWLKDAAPSASLCKWFGHDPSRWEEFQRRYRAELADHPDVLRPLLDAAREEDITLVYGARDEQHNQAGVLRQVLEEWLG